MKKIAIIGLCLIVLSATSFAFAENVYITKNGSKYHKETCRFIKNRDVEEVSKEAAIEEGLKPCSRCYKEDLAISENDTERKTLSTEKKKKKL